MIMLYFLTTSCLIMCVFIKHRTLFYIILIKVSVFLQLRYGWHFPELGKIITDNIAFVKTIKTVGTRDHMITADLSEILPEDLEERVKEAAEISMGTEISDEDIINIKHLCDEILSINEYRIHLSDYLKTRMVAMAPNLTILVGETVGARLIAHAGSLVNLAKHPASTLQILGEWFVDTLVLVQKSYNLMIYKKVSQKFLYERIKCADFIFLAV